MRVLSVALGVVFLTVAGHAQAPAAKPAPAAKAKAKKMSAKGKPDATLAQLMRGILFPNANLLFDTQTSDPGAPRKDQGTATTSATFANVYSGWQVVENAALSLTEVADLIAKPGRFCQNGKPVPLAQKDFRQFTEKLRTAGRAAFKAAQTKNLEKMSDVTNDVADACSSCHEKYRDKGDADSPARCTP